MALSHAPAPVRAQAKRLQGCVQAGLLSREIQVVRGADAVGKAGRRNRRQRSRELPADPARSENLCMHVISPCARTGRSHAHPSW